jgi:hypothetical protein
MSAANVVKWKSPLLSWLQLVRSDESDVLRVQKIAAVAPGLSWLRGNTAITKSRRGDPGATGFPGGPSQPVRGFVYERE